MGHTLVLQLIRYRGKPINLYYEIRDFAFFMKNAIYRICLDSQTDEGAALRICRSTDGWRLINQSTEVHCAVNGVSVAPNHWTRLCDSDVFEWGLSIWRVNPEERFLPEPAQVISKNIDAGETATPLDLAWFDPRMRPMQEEDDPFDLVMPRSLDGLIEPAVNAASESSTGIDSSTDGIFQQLLQEYRQALDTPRLPGSDHVWQEKLLQKDATSGPDTLNLADLSGSVDPLTTLQDLVAGQLHIDEIFDGLDSLREAELFHIEEPPEVLHLFAPSRQPKPAHTPPGLTRKEHHAISVDSHYRMTRFSTHQPKDAADDDHPPQ